MTFGKCKIILKFATACALFGASCGHYVMAFDASSVHQMHVKIQDVQVNINALPKTPELALKIMQLQRDIDLLRAQLNQYENKLSQNMAKPQKQILLGDARPLENPYVSTHINRGNRKLKNEAQNLQQSKDRQLDNLSSGDELSVLNTVPEALRDQSETPKVRAFAVKTISKLKVEPKSMARVAPDILAFNQAKAYFEDGNYRRAERQFYQFIEFYNKSSLTSNAYYWLGQTYFKRANFKVAAMVFYRGYRYNKKGAKAPDSLYQLASSLIELGNKSDACSAFYEINHRYDKSHPKLSNDASMAQKKFGC